jgi:methylmalonyl-CoA mutase
MLDKKLLFTEFPPVSTENWEKVIHEDLKGADYDKKLVWKSPEGFNVKPYYRAEDLTNIAFKNTSPGIFPFVRGGKTNNNWNICQDVVVADIKTANKKAISYLTKGANTINFLLSEEKPFSYEEFQTLLSGINLQKVQLHFQTCGNSQEIINFLYRYGKENRIDQSSIDGSVSLSPLDCLVACGSYCSSNEFPAEHMVSSIGLVAKELPKLKLIKIGGLHFANAGASIVQELAFSLSMGNEYLSLLTDKGLKAEDITPRMFFKFGVGSNYFMEMAKFRAARLLWANIVKAYGVTNDSTCKMDIHAETSRWNATLFDPYVNLLRNTTESMSAVIAGVDTLTVVPFDEANGQTTDLSERIARNLHLVLKEEAHFDKITDPAAGSYYIENITNSIAEQAWKLFKEIEAKGGFTAAMKAGFIQDQIEATYQKRLNLVATRREVLVGTNQYPNFKEKIQNNIAKVKKAEACGCKCGTKKDICKPVIEHRAAEEIEMLRLTTEKSGKTPKVFLLTYGNPTMRVARANFTSNFFACAGFELIDNPGFSSIEEGINAAIQSKAEIVVICSSDDEYATIAVPIFEKLKDKSIVVVAGAPACSDELKSKGISNFISIKQNVLETLKEYQKMLHIL